MYSTLLLVQGKFEEAKHHISQSLTRFPYHFDLLYNLAWLYEQQGKLLDAYYMYSCAEYTATEKDHISDVKEVRQRLKDHRIPMELRFGEDDFMLTIPQQDENARFVYSVPPLLARKQFYEVIVFHLHPETNTILEIECGEGTIARNLASLGYDVVGMDSNSEMISRAILLDLHTRIRVPNDVKQLRLLPYAITPSNITSLQDDYDVIVYSPTSETLHSAPQEALTQLFTHVLQKACRQLFIALPKETTEHSIWHQALLHVVRSRNVTYDRVPVDNDHYAVFYAIASDSNSEKGKTSCSIPQGLAVLNTRSELVNVEISACRDLQGFGYVAPHWHPFVAQIEQYTSNEDIAYDESVLYEFFQAFQPTNQYERFFGRHGRPQPPLHRGWSPLPWLNVQSRHIPTKPFQTRSGGSHFHGPNTDEFGSAELKRIITVYKLMKNNGYKPEVYPDGYIQGLFLKKGNEYRFIVTEGQHRIAALAALGHHTIRCRLAPETHFPRCVDLARIRHRPLVQYGMYPTVIAARMFHVFFATDNKNRLSEWGFTME